MPELAPVTIAILPLSDWTIRRSMLVDDCRRQSKSKAFSVRGSAKTGDFAYTAAIEAKTGDFAYFQPCPLRFCRFNPALRMGTLGIAQQSFRCSGSAWKSGPSTRCIFRIIPDTDPGEE